MILSVLAIGGAFIGATVIGGLLTVYQIRQTADIEASMQAIFAADAGLEWWLREYFSGGAVLAQPTFAVPNVDSETRCFDLARSPIACDRSLGDHAVRSVGTSRDANRSFELEIAF